MSSLKLRMRRLVHRGPLMPDGSIPGRYTSAQKREMADWFDQQMAERSQRQHHQGRHVVEVHEAFDPELTLTAKEQLYGLSRPRLETGRS